MGRCRGDVEWDGAPIELQVKPLQENGEWRLAVVMFIEGEAVEESIAPEQPLTDETVRRLKEELELTQQRLRTMREESDAANEELRASNEELQSIDAAIAERTGGEGRAIRDA
jgi:two-component system CheB/CheR fusion protein